MTARTGRKLLKKVPVKIRDEVLLMDINEIRELNKVLLNSIEDTYEYGINYHPKDKGGGYIKEDYATLQYGNTYRKTKIGDDIYDFHENANGLVFNIADYLKCLASKEQCLTEGAYKVYYNYNTNLFDYKFSAHDMSWDLIDTITNAKEICAILNDSDELLERFK